MNIDTLNRIENFIRQHGEFRLIELISSEIHNETLTIIVNAGIHHYHPLHKRGEVFIASEGTLNFSTHQSAVDAIESVLLRVAKKLKEKRWNKVYLVPFGPAPLSLQIKSLVHKILDIETIDVLHIGNGEHVDISINPRDIASKSNNGAL